MAVLLTVYLFWANLCSRCNPKSMLTILVYGVQDRKKSLNIINLRTTDGHWPEEQGSSFGKKLPLLPFPVWFDDYRSHLRFNSCLCQLASGSLVSWAQFWFQKTFKSANLSSFQRTNTTKPHKAAHTSLVTLSSRPQGNKGSSRSKTWSLLLLPSHHPFPDPRALNLQAL